MKALYAYLVGTILTASLFSCHPKLVAGSDSKNNLLPDNRTNADVQPDLLGSHSRESLQKPPFDEWFVKNYRDYVVDSGVADMLKPILSQKRFLIFMGTWCGDSRREVPRIFKLLDYCGVNTSHIDIVMVSQDDSIYKQSPGHEERGMNIFRVPDLLVFDTGKELGRIVESPVISLEKDLLAICTRHKYIPHYQGAAFLSRLFAQDDPADLEKKLPALAEQIRPLVLSASELKGYAHVLRAAGEKQKSDIALKLNGLIFPNGN